MRKPKAATGTDSVKAAPPTAHRCHASDKLGAVWHAESFAPGMSKPTVYKEQGSNSIIASQNPPERSTGSMAEREGAAAQASAPPGGAMGLHRSGGRS